MLEEKLQIIVIGNRSFSSNPFLVSKLGKICINKFYENNIGTVIKHIPGHGLSKVDSHNKLPIVNHNINLLNKIDFFLLKNKMLFSNDCTYNLQFY